MTDGKNAIFSEKVAAGQRTYFFDVKEATGGAKYLVISESKKVGDGYERNRIVIFNDGVTNFCETMKKAVAAIG